MKRLISLLLVISMFLGILSSCAKEEEANESILNNLGNIEMMTRDEWVILLGQTFGMDQYYGEGAYFSDVTQNSVSYPYVQSSYEWGVFEFESDQLKPDELASREFVAVTALLATGIFRELDKDSLMTIAEDECVVYVEGGDWNAPISHAEGEVAAAIAREMYLNYERPEAIEFTLTDAATDLSYLSPGQMSYAGSSTGGTSSSGSSSGGQSSSGTTSNNDNEDVYTQDSESGIIDNENFSDEDISNILDEENSSLNLDSYTETLNSQLESLTEIVVVDSAIAEDWDEGTIFMAPPTDYYPEGFPYKVVSVEIEGEDAFVEVVIPDFEDVYEELYLHTTVTPDFSQMVLSEGITFAGGNALLTSETVQPVEKTGITNLSYKQTNEMTVATPMASFVNKTFEVNLTKGTMSFSPYWENSKLSIGGIVPTLPFEATGVMLDDLSKFSETNFIKSVPISYGTLLDTDETRGWEEMLNVEEKYSGGYDITGSISLENFEISTTIDWKFLTPREVVIQMSGDIIPALKVKGKVSGEISIGTVPIPIPQVPGLSVELALFLYTDASGELSVKAVCSNSVKIEYSSGSVKKVQNNTVTPQIESKIQIEAGAGFRAGLVYIKSDLIDVSAKVGVYASTEASIVAEKSESVTQVSTDNVEANLKITEISLKVANEVNLAYPIVTLAIGGKSGSWVNKIGLSYSWSILDKDNAPMSVSLTNEVTPFYLITVETEITEEEVEEIEEENDEIEEDYNEFAMLVIDKYLYSLETGGKEQIKISQFPSGENINHVTFTSTNPSVATVSSTGSITAVGGGSAQIYATTPSGGLQVCAVKVNGDGNGYKAEDFL